jgi:GNAT superfamily N-acetyltransferase
MSKPLELVRTRVWAAYGCRGMDRLVLRHFDTELDSLDELTGILHRSFARLGAMGLNCTCVDQSCKTTLERAKRGDCYVAICDDHLVGTLTVNAPDQNARCEFYRHPDVASIHQLGVDPAYQGRGIGKSLLSLAEGWAAIRGYKILALDTPMPASHLISFYEGRGFGIAGSLRFEGKRYVSAILSKEVMSTRRLALATYVPTADISQTDDIRAA